jgi:septal ring factor EnvC (AmiA/AmiB activator)
VSRRLLTALCTALLATAAMAATAPHAAAQERVQQDLRASRLRLDSILQERQRLQSEMKTLQNSVRNASRELNNIERQRATSRAALLELEHQADLLRSNVLATEASLDSTRMRLRSRTEALRNRLRTIYKHGPMHSVRVLLTAESFADLMNRYKYLHIVTMTERMMIDDVARLEKNLLHQQNELTATLATLETLHAEKAQQANQLQRVEQQRQSTLRNFKLKESRTATQLDILEKEQAKLTDAVAALERKRREAESKSSASSTSSTLSTRDLGQLNWPIEGQLVYRFGPDRKANGIVLKNNGIGIGAAAGAPVKSVEAGTVELAGPFPGYGSAVIVSHGGGYRTLYLWLNTVRVSEGQKITAGQVVGTVGGEQTEEGPHIEFQVRVPITPGKIEAVDPLTWLRSRTGQ